MRYAGVISYPAVGVLKVTICVEGTANKILENWKLVWTATDEANENIALI